MKNSGGLRAEESTGVAPLFDCDNDDAKWRLASWEKSVRDLSGNNRNETRSEMCFKKWMLDWEYGGAAIFS